MNERSLDDFTKHRALLSIKKNSESRMKSQIFHYFEKWNLFFDKQFGFPDKKSTSLTVWFLKVDSIPTRHFSTSMHITWYPSWKNVPLQLWWSQGVAHASCLKCIKSWVLQGSVLELYWNCASYLCKRSNSVSNSIRHFEKMLFYFLEGVLNSNFSLIESCFSQLFKTTFL